MGNSASIILPGPVLAELGVKAIADAGDDGLVWPEFGNAGDDAVQAVNERLEQHLEGRESLQGQGALPHRHDSKTRVIRRLRRLGSKAADKTDRSTDRLSRFSPM